MAIDFAPLIDDDDLGPAERGDLVRLMRIVEDRPAPPVGGSLPGYRDLRTRFLDAAAAGEREDCEEAFLELYAHLHMHEAPYTPGERDTMNRTGGYWCHAGGLSPILRSGEFLRPESTSCDLGAGNGLQTLLMQALHPHAKTIQIELSSRMIGIGRSLQAWLGIARERVEWIAADLNDVEFPEVDLLYLYRPMKPEGVGSAFYRRLAAHLEGARRPVTILSIADCLRDFLPPEFQQVFGNGHLTIWRN